MAEILGCTDEIVRRRVNELVDPKDPVGERYSRTMSYLGFDVSHLSGEAGHA